MDEHVNKYGINRVQSKFVICSIENFWIILQNWTWLFSNGNMLLMANTTNNIRSNTTITTNSRPDNNSLPSSGTQSIPQDKRDLLHPKVRFLTCIYFHRNLNWL